VEKPDSSRTLCRIPSKFSKILWVRAGSFIVARFEEEALDESSHDAKVTGEMTRALYHTQMKEMRRANRWPALFAETETEAERTAEDADEESGDGDERDAASDDSLPPIEVIRNRPRRAREESSSSDSGDEEQS
jgi:probable RNA-binding protein EIF1AD